MPRSRLALIPLSLVVGCRCSPASTTERAPEPSHAASPLVSPSASAERPQAPPPATVSDCPGLVPGLTGTFDGAALDGSRFRPVYDSEVGRLVIGAFQDDQAPRRLRLGFGRMKVGTSTAADADADIIVMSPDFTCRGDEVTGTLTITRLAPAGPTTDIACAVADVACSDHETSHHLEVHWAFRTAVPRTALPGSPPAPLPAPPRPE